MKTKRLWPRQAWGGAYIGNQGFWGSLAKSSGTANNSLDGVGVRWAISLRSRDRKRVQSYLLAQPSAQALTKDRIHQGVGGIRKLSKNISHCLVRSHSNPLTFRISITLKMTHLRLYPERCLPDGTSEADL